MQIAEIFFRQLKQKAQAILCVLTSIFVIDAGKRAGKMYAQELISAYLMVFCLINKVEIATVNTSNLPILSNKKNELLMRIKNGEKLMRLDLNLNQYYDDLEIGQVNKIFSKFTDLKLRMETMREKLSKPKEELAGRLSWKVEREILMERCQEINEIMLEFGKEPVFDVKGMDDTDFEAIVSEYEYLMSKPGQNAEKSDGREKTE